MKIEIQGYLAASDLLSRTTETWDAIFIIDSGFAIHPKAIELTRRHLVLSFDDIERPQNGRVICQQSHIEAAIYFAKGSENLLVSCRAGQSRSAAIAYLILCHYSDPEAALEVLEPYRHRPNRKVLDLGNQLLDDPALTITIRNWAAEHAVGPMDLEKIEANINALIDQGVTDIVSNPLLTHV